jgi:hypothetical protein
MGNKPKNRFVTPRFGRKLPYIKAECSGKYPVGNHQMFSDAGLQQAQNWHNFSLFLYGNTVVNQF